MVGMDLNRKRTIVIGGVGFLGKYVTQKLTEKGAVVTAPTKAQYDLTSKEAIQELFRKTNPEIIINLVAEVGIETNPGHFFYSNLIMNINLIEQSREWMNITLEKFVQVGVTSHDITKILLKMLQVYRQQYKFNGIYLLPMNICVEDYANGIVKATEVYNKPKPINFKLLSQISFMK
jgi:GDP-L-fucose synthase